MLAVEIDDICYFRNVRHSYTESFQIWTKNDNYTTLTVNEFIKMFEHKSKPSIKLEKYEKRLLIIVSIAFIFIIISFLMDTLGYCKK